MPYGIGRTSWGLASATSIEVDTLGRETAGGLEAWIAPSRHVRPLSRHGRGDVIEADRLLAAGRLLDAVDLLAATYRASADPALAIRLVDLRQEAARSFVPGPGRSPWPPTYGDSFPHLSGGLPETGVAELTSDVLGGAVAHHGALIVRGMFDEAQVRHSVDVIHNAQAHATTAQPRPPSVGGTGRSPPMSGDTKHFARGPPPPAAHGSLTRR